MDWADFALLVGGDEGLWRATQPETVSLGLAGAPYWHERLLAGLT